MPAVIEVTSTIHHNNSELEIRISGEIKGNAESKLREIRSILAQAKAVFNGVSGANGENEVPMQQASSTLSKLDLITDEQVRTLSWILFRRRVQESDFYKMYGISRMEDLTREKANRIINDLAKR